MKILSWTDEQVEQLKSLWAQGLPCSQIAKEMDAPSRNAIIGKVRRLGLERRREGVNPLAARERAQRPPRPERAFKPRPMPKFMPAPVIEVIDLPPETPVNPVALFDLQDHHCRWPLGEPHHEMLHCGAQVADDRPYCPAHCRMAYQPTPGRLRPPYGAVNPRAKREAA